MGWEICQGKRYKSKQLFRFWYRATWRHTGSAPCRPAFGLRGQHLAPVDGSRRGCLAVYNESVPEISRFFGIIVRMFAEAGSPHQVAHFHAYYQDEVGIFSIDPIELIAGSLPRRQRRFVEAWAELHQGELRVDWQRLQEGRKPAPIEPLK